MSGSNQIYYPSQEHKRLFIIGPPRCATTFLLESLSRTENGYGVYEPLQGALAYDETEDQDTLIQGVRSYYSDVIDSASLSQKADDLFVLKEALSLKVITAIEDTVRTDDKITEFFQLKKGTHVVWIFRNPIDVYASIKHRDWFGLDQFLHIYTVALNYCHAMCKSGRKPIIVFQEDLLDENRKHAVLKNICKAVGLNFSDTILRPQDDNEKDMSARIYLNEGQTSFRKTHDHHKTIKTNKVINKRDLLTDIEISEIQKNLMSGYTCIQDFAHRLMS